MNCDCMLYLFKPYGAKGRGIKKLVFPMKRPDTVHIWMVPSFSSLSNINCCHILLLYITNQAYYLLTILRFFYILQMNMKAAQSSLATVLYKSWNIYTFYIMKHVKFNSKFEIHIFLNSSLFYTNLKLLYLKKIKTRWIFQAT